MPSVNAPRLQTATYIADPLAFRRRRIELKFQNSNFAAFESGGLAGITNPDIFKGAVLGAVVGADGWYRLVGSAVMVAPGIALTATHVLAEYAHYDPSAISWTLMSPVEGGLMLWGGRQSFMSAGNDIAIFASVAASALPPQNLYTTAFPSTRTPRLGESLMICGFRPQREKYQDTSQFTIHPYISTGKVTQVFACGRDRVLMPGPCVELDCHAVGSMSGGPVFDGDGYLVGILSTSLESAQLNGPSYVSLIWPVIALSFRPHWLTEWLGEQTSLNRCIGKGCSIEREEAVTVLNNAPVYREWTTRGSSGFLEIDPKTSGLDS
ncbi:MAG: trypsin-like peptidase domain-containing protein [Opitutaceae bacterium]|nr:trypsin-like peptidase domain-containing protein [Opitutaceae bacterium]